MTRDATAGAITESKLEAPRPFVFVELDFPTGFVRLNSTDRSIFFDSGSGSVEFLGKGNMGSVSTIGEGAGLQAQGVELSLSGIPGSHISAAFENAQRRAGKVWVGFLDSSYALVSDPVLVFSGLVDNSAIELGETATVTIFLESRLITWERVKIQRYTNESQQQLFAGDKFLEFVNQMVEKELIWGVPNPEQVPRRIRVGGRGSEGPIQIVPGGGGPDDVMKVGGGEGGAR